MLRQRFHQFFFHGLNLCRFESKREDRAENRLIDHSSDRAHFTTGPEIGKKKSIRKKPDNSTLIRLLNFGAVGETRTHTTFVTTPSRWRVYQFHHDGLAIKFFGAFDETRTHTTFVTTPSRWRVYQFHHEGLFFNFFFRFRFHQNRKTTFYLGI